MKKLFSTNELLYATTYLRPARLKTYICTDASPTGGGAVLYVVDARTRFTLETLTAAKPWAWAAHRWTHHDEVLAAGARDDPGSQARWEAYAAVSALFLWKKIALETRGGIALVGDALGVLFGTAVLRSKDKQINKLMQELALVLAPSGNSIEALHVWSEDNKLADDLSRLDDNESNIPEIVASVSRTPWAETTFWQIVSERV